jgi:hypothetical protein
MLFGPIISQYSFSGALIKKSGEQDAAATKIHEHTSRKYRNLKSLNNELPEDSAFVFEDTDDIVYSWYSIF